MNQTKIFASNAKISFLQCVHSLVALRRGMDKWIKMLHSLQEADGKPVHLKRPGDKALMYLTFAGCGVGLVGVAQLFYQLS